MLHRDVKPVIDWNIGFKLQQRPSPDLQLIDSIAIFSMSQLTINFYIMKSDLAKDEFLRL